VGKDLHHEQRGNGRGGVIVTNSAIDPRIGAADIAGGDSNREISREPPAFMAAQLIVHHGESARDDLVMALLRARHGDRDTIEMFVAQLLVQAPLQEFFR
jgi:hypothetical protein